MKERNHVFDLLCGLCIVRMVMLHIVSMAGFRGEYHFGKVMAWTFFFLCFFFFKAGYFNKGVTQPLRSYLPDRVRRLLVPYLTWGLIGSIVYFGFLHFWPHTFRAYTRLFRWHHLWRQSHFYGNPPVWFLMSFFSTYMVVWLVETKARVLRWLFVLMPFLSYWLYRQHNPQWMSLSNVPMGYFAFELGRNWHDVQRRLGKWLFLGISIALVLFFVYGNRHWHGEYDMSLNKWVQRPWGAIANIVAALCGISGVLLSWRRLPRIPFLNFVGEHSMVFFVMHYPLIFLYHFTLRLCGHNMRHSWWHITVLAILIFTLCSLLVPYIERVPWLSGRWKKNAKPEHTTC